MEVVSGPRTLLLLANRARPDPEIPLDDLTGQGGRFDLVARFVNAALLTSHGIREDAQAIVVFAGADDPLALRVRGEAATGVGPDERSTAARLLDALEATAMPVWQEVEDGIDLRSGELWTVLADAPEPHVLMHEDGEPIEQAPAGGTFVVGDQDGFTDDQRARLGKRVDRVARLGPRALQADHLVAALHHELDGSGSMDR